MDRSSVRYNPRMSTTSALNRNALFGFALFLALTLIAFWPTYLSRLGEQPTYHFHLHGILMVLWLALLVTQAHLIRAKRRPLHRKLRLRSRDRTYAFPVALIVLLTYHVSVLTFYELPAWRAFCRWLLQLPLS